MAGSNPNLSLCSRQPFGFRIILKNIKVIVINWLKISGLKDILVMCNLTFPPIKFKIDKYCKSV